MRAGIAIVGFLVLSTLSIASAPAEARPVVPSGAAEAAESPILKTAHRTKARHVRHHTGHRTRHRRSHAGWLPRLKEHPHLPGIWDHDHCHDWHRCHYYFYGYEQWVKWNPDKSRAYYRRHYHN